MISVTRIDSNCITLIFDITFIISLRVYIGEVISLPNCIRDILGPKILIVCGLAKFVPAVSFHFCLNLPATFSQPHTSNVFGPSTD